MSSSIWLSHLAVCATLLSQSHAKLIHIYQGLGYQLFGIQLGSLNLYPNDPTSLRTLQIIANFLPLVYGSIIGAKPEDWILNHVIFLIRPTNSSNVMSTTDRFLEVLEIFKTITRFGISQVSSCCKSDAQLSLADPEEPGAALQHRSLSNIYRVTLSPTIDLAYDIVNP